MGNIGFLMLGRGGSGVDAFMQHFLLLIDKISTKGYFLLSSQAKMRSNISSSTGCQKKFPSSVMRLTFLRSISKILPACLHFKKRQIVNQRCIYAFIMTPPE